MTQLVEIVAVLPKIITDPVEKRHPRKRVMSPDKHQVTRNQDDRIGKHGISELLKCGHQND